MEALIAKKACTYTTNERCHVRISNQLASFNIKDGSTPDFTYPGSACLPLPSVRRCDLVRAGTVNACTAIALTHPGRLIVV